MLNGKYIKVSGKLVQVAEKPSKDRTLATSELACPVVVTPGDYFTCKVDIPFGTNVRAKVQLIDSVTETMMEQSSWMHLPGDC